MNWVQRSSKAAWPQRAGHSSVFLNGRIFVLGGFGGTHALNDVWYSADGINWFVATKAAAWTARGAARAVVYDNAIYLMGGQALTSAGDAAALPSARKRAAQNVVLFNDVWRSGNGGTLMPLTHLYTPPFPDLMTMLLQSRGCVSPLVRRGASEACLASSCTLASSFSLAAAPTPTTSGAPTMAVMPSHT